MSNGNEVWLLAQEANLLRVRCALEGMIAANMSRQRLDKSLAYTERDFDELASECERFSETYKYMADRTGQ